MLSKCRKHGKVPKCIAIQKNSILITKRSFNTRHILFSIKRCMLTVHSLAITDIKGKALKSTNITSVMKDHGLLKSLHVRPKELEGLKFKTKVRDSDGNV